MFFFSFFLLPFCLLSSFNPLLCSCSVSLQKMVSMYLRLIQNSLFRVIAILGTSMSSYSIMLFFIILLSSFFPLSLCLLDSADAELELAMVRHQPEGLDKLQAQTKFTRKELQSLYRGFKNVRMDFVFNLKDDELKNSHEKWNRNRRKRWK